MIIYATQTIQWVYVLMFKRFKFWTGKQRFLFPLPLSRRHS